MNRDEKFIFSSSAKKKLFITLGIGVLLFAIGVFMLATGSAHHDEGHGHEAVVREGFHAVVEHAVTGDSSTEYNAQTEHLEGVHASEKLEEITVDTAAAEQASVEDTLAAHEAVAQATTVDTTESDLELAHDNAHVKPEAIGQSVEDDHSKGHGEEAHASSEHHAEAAHGGGHHEAHWTLRIIKDLWLNNVFFAGIALIGVFFIAFNYIAWAGWSAGIKRIPEAFGAYLPVAAILTIVLLVFFHHDLFHWTHADLYDKASVDYDSILDGKKGYLNFPFFIIRAVVYFAIWISLWKVLRNFSIQQDLTGDLKYHFKSVVWSAVFVVTFGITESMAAWDWLMSTDPHFFSTMYGWYVFASWFVSGLAMITLFVVVLKENGYLSFINENHLHDLGKFVFAFTVFWTYVWFEQFLLIYYANIPEEVGYFVQRLKSDAYTPIFFLSLVINFGFPFLGLMTRAAKRQGAILKVVCVGVIMGHWLDFYMMITPPILGQSGGLDVKFLFVEVGMTMIFASVFLFTILTALSKVGLVAKNHPMLEESEHHSVF
ncbi:MAG: quinol:cytochrome c oxidoreductase quinone-binding subunit 2 [Chitinophagaceae bacterium]|nr:quinol:cytochrome c oxidoreductase quinone-binding subunit 2 [Chitinophagaceae bacterium]